MLNIRTFQSEYRAKSRIGRTFRRLVSSLRISGTNGVVLERLCALVAEAAFPARGFVVDSDSPRIIVPCGHEYFTDEHVAGVRCRERVLHHHAGADVVVVGTE